MIAFSFIIPVYNCIEYLEKCTGSISKVYLGNYEIILVDDGSTDGSGVLCDGLAQRYSYITCIHQDNQGVSAARNRGLRVATGDYVIFLDADDSVDHEKLEEVLRIVQENTDIDMAIFGLSFDYYYHGKCYRREELRPPCCGKLEGQDWVEMLPELYQTNAISPIWNKVIRRSILQKNQLSFREDIFIYEDLEFSLRCMAHCKTIYFSQKVIYHYRQSEDEGNAGRRLKRIDHLPVLMDRIEGALNELIRSQHAGVDEGQMNSILLSLYLTLVREKIAVSNSKKIGAVCDDFAEWFRGKSIETPSDSSKFVGWILERRVYWLMLRQAYSAVRHSVAVKVKNTKWYQKMIFSSSNI